MRKAINQGTTLFAVSGTNRTNARFWSLYVAKKKIEHVEDNIFIFKSVGTKQVFQTKEDIEKLDGMSKLIAKSRGLKRAIHITEQGINKVIKPHIIIYSKSGKKYDIDIIDDNSTRYFKSRKKAKKYYRKLMSRSNLMFFDESCGFLTKIPKIIY